MQPALIHNNIYQCLDRTLADKLDLYLRADRDFWIGSSFVASARYGPQSVWNFVNDIPMSTNPGLDSTDHRNFEQVTDLRSAQFSESIQRTGRRIAVLWSGGIDSTVILAAMARNFTDDEISQVDVYMNDISYSENPMFYHDVITKRGFHCENINDIGPGSLEQLFSQCTVVDGEPADKIWIGATGLHYCEIHGFKSLQESCSTATDKLISYLELYMDPTQARYYWQWVGQNIIETSAPVESVGQWFWWINFNYHWNGHVLDWYMKFPNKTSENWDYYCKNYQPWYVSPEYQIWSMRDQSRFEIRDMTRYKWSAKQYIHSVSPNDYYLEFKTKQGSGSRGSARYQGLVIFQDGTALDQRDQIQDFVSQHYLGA